MVRPTPHKSSNNLMPRALTYPSHRPNPSWGSRRPNTSPIQNPEFYCQSKKEKVKVEINHSIFTKSKKWQKHKHNP
jgi:hypothetical protein